MGSQYVYNNDPTLEPLPLSVEEASALAENSKIVSKHDIKHLLKRVLATAVQVRDVRRHFDEEMRRRTSALPRPGLQATLSPEQAVRFLSPEQMTKLFDKLSQERLQALTLLRERAESRTQKLAAAISDITAIVLAAVNQPGFDPTTATKLREILDQMRDASGETAEETTIT